jgi:hypothetical protein
MKDNTHSNGIAKPNNKELETVANGTAKK